MGNSGEESGGEIRSYRDLKVWQHAFKLGLAVYELTRSMPESERFGLISQLRRGAVSVPSNIAEGYGRGSRSDYTRFLKVARGILFELETQMLFAAELKYITPDDNTVIRQRIDETARILAGLIRSLEPA